MGCVECYPNNPCKSCDGCPRCQPDDPVHIALVQKRQREIEKEELYKIVGSSKARVFKSHTIGTNRLGDFLGELPENCEVVVVERRFGRSRKQRGRMNEYVRLTHPLRGWIWNGFIDIDTGNEFARRLEIVSRNVVRFREDPKIL